MGNIYQLKVINTVKTMRTITLEPGTENKSRDTTGITHTGRGRNR